MKCSLCITIDNTNRIECFDFPRRVKKTGEIIYECDVSPYGSVTFKEMTQEEYEEFKNWYINETEEITQY